MIPKVLVGCPSYDGWIRADQHQFYQDCRGAILQPPVCSMPTDVARNYLVAVAHKRKCDLVFMLDADAVPLEGTYWSLVNKCLEEHCVAAAPYAMHGGGVVPLGGQDIEGWKRTTEIVGTHCLCYNLKVFDKIKPPYFEYKYNADHTGLLNTEDAVCHQKLLDAGVPFWVDGHHWAGHAKTHVLERPKAFRVF